MQARDPCTTGPPRVGGGASSKALFLGLDKKMPPPVDRAAQGYLAHEKLPPSHALGIHPLPGPRRGLFLMREVPLYAYAQGPANVLGVGGRVKGKGRAL